MSPASGFEHHQWSKGRITKRKVIPGGESKEDQGNFDVKGN
jgi:hypothetical protein